MLGTIGINEVGSIATIISAILLAISLIITLNQKIENIIRIILLTLLLIFVILYYFTINMTRVCGEEPQLALLPEEDLYCTRQTNGTMSYTLMVPDFDTINQINDKIIDKDISWRRLHGIEKTYSEKTKELSVVSARGMKIKKVEVRQSGNSKFGVPDPNSSPSIPSKVYKCPDLSMVTLADALVFGPVAKPQFQIECTLDGNEQRTIIVYLEKKDLVEIEHSYFIPGGIH